MKIIRSITSDNQTLHAVQNPDGTYNAIEGDIFGQHTVTDRKVTVQKILHPILPTSIIGIGANYKSLFKDKPLPQYPIVFLKTNSTAHPPEDPMILPRLKIQSETVKYEGELVVVIGKKGKNIDHADAMDYVYGYTIANDMSGFDWQGDKVGGQWAKGKSFDTFCPFGPVLVTADEIPDPAALQIVTRIDGAIEQNESVGGMCFSVPELIAFLSAGQTLFPGDIILTGSPLGARFIKPGETVAITIEGIGTLTNQAIEETA